MGSEDEKAYDPLAHVVHQDHVIRARNADHAARTCERFVYSIAKNNEILLLSNMADTFFEKFTRFAKVYGLSFLDRAFGMLIGWTDKPRSHGTCTHVYGLWYFAKRYFAKQ